MSPRPKTGQNGDSPITRKKHTAEQIVKKLRVADQLRSEGKTTAQVARQLEISEQTFHRWKNRFGDMQGDQVKRLKELEHENSRLKKMVADQALDIDALKELNRGNF